ncbi:MAG: alpha/beta hydrolase [Eubacteriales bacterium]|nr:alpha/beta hydrolase [Eubacteriales bacterium]
MKHFEIPVALPQGTEAKLYPYLLDNYDEIDPNRKRPLVLVIPGGGYGEVSRREAEGVAVRFLAAGFHAAVLRYSITPAEFPQSLIELAFSVAYLREHAKEWAIDENKIVVAGFSAGGHLAASLAVFWNQEWLWKELGLSGCQIKPNGLLLSYPVISSGKYRHENSFKNLLGKKDSPEMRELVSLEKQVSADVPPTFAWHTITDPAVPVQNSILFTSALIEHGVSVEQHLFSIGDHALALADEETMTVNNGRGIEKRCQPWLDLAIAWLRDLN